MKKSLLASLALATMLASGAAMAQTAVAPVAAAPAVEVPGHPRVQEIDQRLENQQTRVNEGVQQGTINAKQAARDEARDTKVSQELSADEAKNGGHITKAEQAHMNKQLDRNSKHIHHQRKNGPVSAMPASATPAQ